MPRRLHFRRPITETVYPMVGNASTGRCRGTVGRRFDAVTPVGRLLATTVRFEEFQSTDSDRYESDKGKSIRPRTPWCRTNRSNPASKDEPLRQRRAAPEGFVISRGLAAEVSRSLRPSQQRRDQPDSHCQIAAVRALRRVRRRQRGHRQLARQPAGIRTSPGAPSSRFGGGALPA
jgi:hypothetical protein